MEAVSYTHLTSILLNTVILVYIVKLDKNGYIIFLSIAALFMLHKGMNAGSLVGVNVLRHAGVFLCRSDSVARLFINNVFTYWPPFGTLPKLAD